ncbi:SHOCT domain-containing protein [Cronbergia sp. UHCC 0137]|uniref:SHOCT domain-containing protein n=1 Tax=Cronbergia sp. UHCC 0137 TaxID=3110239 RepID=UPI002B20053D|nr:SHOCT domain-containing protein [Cronbergia sp. UHCC 0137]MEA5616992.1 SHOCT domain-containing protein [Cronbergia sp. UHCC 0137]
MNKENLSVWNPFIPTERDITRKSELAQKNAILAGVLSFIFLPAGLIYLNRAINPLKIFGYTIILSVLVNMGSSSNTEENSTNFISFLGISAITAEQVIAVKSARQKLGGKTTSVPSSNFGDSVQSSLSYKTDDKAVKLLKELKEKYEANEISEEEFKLQKQKILDSL